ncbi:histidine--tRNA ligase, partial [Candidatus Aerophobetes bacterium]
RAFIENGLHQQGSNHKLFYIGPFFRYDRPQAGRYRQFHQFGAESIGKASPERDFETIMMLYTLYKNLGLNHLDVLINTLGDKESRKRYTSELKAFLTPHVSKLSADSKKRFSDNPLRILDTKNPEEIVLLEKAPSILDCVNTESRRHFETVVKYLLEQKVPVTVKPSLVRGLDYYNETVFEITSPTLGAQNSLGGGGRYDSLIKSYGGPDLPAIGFGTGIERILLTMLAQGVTTAPPPSPFFNIIVMHPEAKPKLAIVTQQLRESGLAGEMLEVKKIQKGLAETNKQGALYALIIGSNEWEKKEFQLKCMRSGKLTTHPIDRAKDILKSQWENYAANS